jgi:hypothetical protein
VSHGCAGRGQGQEGARWVGRGVAVRRVMILGPPGSGKSTLARQLGARHGLPVFHLDQAYWRRGWIMAPPEEFRAEVDRIASLPAWIIDGNYTFVVESRLRAADTMIYLDVPSWLSLWRIVRRGLSSCGTVRPDAALVARKNGTRGSCVSPGTGIGRAGVGISTLSSGLTAEGSCCEDEPRCDGS